MAAKSAAGETLSAPKVDSVNTFEALSTVAPRPVWAKVQAGNLSLKLDPKSVTVIGAGVLRSRAGDVAGLPGLL